MTKIRVAGVSDTGPIRTLNEDRYYPQAPLKDSRESALGRLLIVADGMGGALAGEVASQIAVETIRALFEGAPASKPVDKALSDAIASANSEVYRQSRNDASRKGMGTTVVCAVIGSTNLIVGHVGDSRAYLLRGGQLQRLTQDHSLLQRQIELGHISKEEAEVSDQKNVILRALGVKSTVETDLSAHALQSRDVVLLCTDGICGCLTDDVIRGELLAGGGDPKSMAQRLVDRANETSGEDNATAVVAIVDDVGDPMQDTLPGLPVAGVAISGSQTTSFRRDTNKRHPSPAVGEVVLPEIAAADDPTSARLALRQRSAMAAALIIAVCIGVPAILFAMGAGQNSMSSPEPIALVTLRPPPTTPANIGPATPTVVVAPSRTFAPTESPVRTAVPMPPATATLGPETPVATSTMPPPSRTIIPPTKPPAPEATLTSTKPSATVTAAPSVTLTPSIVPTSTGMQVYSVTVVAGQNAKLLSGSEPSLSVKDLAAGPVFVAITTNADLQPSIVSLTVKSLTTDGRPLSIKFSNAVVVDPGNWQPISFTVTLLSGQLRAGTASYGFSLKANDRLAVGSGMELILQFSAAGLAPGDTVPVNVVISAVAPEKRRGQYTALWLP